MFEPLALVGNITVTSTVCVKKFSLFRQVCFSVLKICWEKNFFPMGSGNSGITMLFNIVCIQCDTVVYTFLFGLYLGAPIAEA